MTSVSRNSVDRASFFHRDSPVTSPTPAARVKHFGEAPGADADVAAQARSVAAVVDGGANESTTSALTFSLMQRGTVAELRILGSRQGTISGYFDDFDRMMSAARCWSGKAKGVYTTLNPVHPDLLSRAVNRVIPYARLTTTDSDIVRRVWLPLDVDPVRAAGISATEAEHDAALERARKCSDYLRGLGWPEPILADSGNGAHVLYAIDLPNDDAACELVRRVIEAVALRFSDEVIDVDLKTFNAARIWKVYGTLAAKGDSTPDRPHRLAQVLEVPAVLEKASKQQLEALAATVVDPAPRSNGRRSSFDIRTWLRRNNIAVAKESGWKSGGRKWVLESCPYNAEHENTAFIVQQPSGAIGAGCLHESCRWCWQDLRRKYEGVGERQAHAPSVTVLDVRAIKVEAKPWPEEALEGDLISDYTHAVTDGTQVPPQFVREQVLAALGAVTNERTTFPGHPGLHSRRYLALVSEQPQGGKFESWKRTVGEPSNCLRSLLDNAGIEALHGGLFGSGQYAAKILEAHPHALVFFDEGRELFKKVEQQGSTLVTALLSLYDGHSYWSGSHKNAEHGGDNIHLSVTFHFTAASFADSFTGHGCGGDGFLSRVTLAYSQPIAFRGEWAERDRKKEERIVSAIQKLLAKHYAPAISTEARLLLQDFWKAIESSGGGSTSHARRLVNLVKQDIIARALFRGRTEINADHVRRGIAWGQHQLYLREALWPVDRGGRVEVMEQLIVRALGKYPMLPERDLQKVCHVHRPGSGGHEAFNRAIQALLRAGRIRGVGLTRKGATVYGLIDDEEYAESPPVAGGDCSA